MNKTAPTRSPVLRSFSAYLATGPAAAAQARRYVRAAIETWGISADQYTAALLTSELVTNAIKHAGGPVRLFVTCNGAQLRVNVHDRSPESPAALDTPVEAEDGRGLTLVENLSTDWGWYRTPVGKAVYFTLALAAPLDDL